MLPKRLVLSLLAIVVFALVFISTYAFATSNSSFSPQTSSNLPSCQTISYSGPDKFNILFFGSDSDAKRYSAFLLKGPPFESNPQEFNIYSISDFDATKECSNYQDIAVLCYSRELIKAAAACPHNAIVVPVSKPSSIRSSTYQGVISLNKNHPPAAVLRHEFGHVLGLAEEYVPANLPKGQMNCKSSCSEFNKLSEGCFEGCSKNNLFRSKEKGVMRTLDTIDYGTYDNYLVLNAIKSLSPKTSITANAISISDNCIDQQYYLFKLTPSEKGFLIDSVSKEQGCASQNLPGEYKIKIEDQIGETQSTLSINDLTMFTDAPSETDSKLIDGQTYSGPVIWGTVPANSPTSPTSESQKISIEDENGQVLASTITTLTGDYLCEA